MRYFVTLGGREISVDVTALSGGGWSVTVDGHPVPFDAVAAGGALSAIVDGQVVDLCLEGVPPDLAFGTLSGAGTARIESERSRSSAAAGGRGASRARKAVLAPMPGRIVRVLVSPGDRVEADAPIAVIEAMKMENELRSPHAATIAEVLVAPGDTVEGGAKLVQFE